MYLIKFGRSKKCFNLGTASVLFNPHSLWCPN